MHDEKLTAIGIWSGIGHGQSAAQIFAGKRFIVKFVSRSASAISFRVAALNHKVFNGSVKNYVVVKIFLGQENKIVYSYRCHAGV